MLFNRNRYRMTAVWSYNAGSNCALINSDLHSAHIQNRGEKANRIEAFLEKLESIVYPL